MIDLATRRRCFAEDLQAIANLRTPALVEAFATVPRERFLDAGPWLVRGESDAAGAPPRLTPDADPQHVYHNHSIAIDPARQLFNGSPHVIAPCIDALALAPGARVLHVGCGRGYYSAVLAQTIGPSGRVVAIEIDDTLALAAGDALARWPSVEVRQGDGTAIGGERFDGILINAGVTHPLDAWLDALAPGGHVVFPLTVSMPAMGTIGKGILVHLAREDDRFAASVLNFVAIYSALALRDEGLNRRLGEALRTMPFPRLSGLRRDAHEPTGACWLHGDRFCLGAAAPV